MEYVTKSEVRTVDTITKLSSNFLFINKIEHIQEFHINPKYDPFLIFDNSLESPELMFVLNALETSWRFVDGKSRGNSALFIFIRPITIYSVNII